MSAIGHGSRYVDRREVPDPYGEFPEDVILGEPCTTVCLSVGDGDRAVTDALGVPMRRGSAAIHVSGRNEYGETVGPGRVEGICLLEHRWHKKYDSGHINDRPPSGTGCSGPEGCVLVSWSEGYTPFDRTRHLHHAFWGSAHFYWTLQGIYETWRSMASLGMGAAVTPREICEWTDVVREEKKGSPLSSYEQFAGDKMHERAVHRLLLGYLDVSNIGAAVPDPAKPLWRARLVRSGRWAYTFEGGPPASPPEVR